jgi:hypothetical protein
MTLFDMIKDWDYVSIEKRPDEKAIEFNRNRVIKMRELVGGDAIILQLEGYSGPLFGAGFIVALNQSGDIIATERTFIS